MIQRKVKLWIFAASEAKVNFKIYFMHPDAAAVSTQILASLILI